MNKQEKHFTAQRCVATHFSQFKLGNVNKFSEYDHNNMHGMKHMTHIMKNHMVKPGVLLVKISILLTGYWIVQRGKFPGKN